MSFRLLSHPDYKLQKHLSGVYQKGMDIFNNNSIFTEDKTLIRLILLFHDLGKASSYFQTYIKNRDKPHSDLKNHAEISALWFFYYAKDIIKLPFKDCYLGYICIKKHHGDIENFRDNANSILSEKVLKISQEIYYKELREIYSSFIDSSILTDANFIDFYKQYPRISKFTRKLKKEFGNNDYLRLNYLFSILLSADKGDAIWKKEFEQLKSITFPNNIVDNYKKKFPINEDVITKVRNQSYKEVEKNICDKNIFSVNLPTGSGKTLNLFNAALKLRKSNNQKIIYCLPFTSVIDQNMDVFEDVLHYNKIKPTTDIILKHHHLSEVKYSMKNNEDYYENKSEYLIENWNSQIIVTTFYQLLLTIFSNKNKMLKKFHALANSIIILDEVQTIPIKYWELTNSVFVQLSILMKTKFILGTATMPLIFDENQGEIFELATSKREYFASLNRICIDCSLIKHEMKLCEFSETLSKHYELDIEKSRLVIVNTVKASLDLYKELKNLIPENNLIYLSTNVLPIERKRRIENIRDNSKGKIIISTQLVEAGVDIDIDIVYRDFAPLDSVFQACGRCNRNDSNDSGKVYLLNLVNENKKKYRTYIYDNMLLSQTEKCFREKNIVEEREFLNLAKTYFQNIKTKKSDANSAKLIEEIYSLNYENAFSYPQNKEAFHLIEKINVVSAFIEVDESSEILQKYYLSREKTFDNPFEKKSYMKALHKEMSPFIINVAVKYADQEDGLWIINKEMIDNKYDLITGFKRELEIQDFIF